MSPRLKIRAAATPLVLAGALWGSPASLPEALAGRPQTPPPCTVDGICKPNAVWGYYTTNWRQFPGDVAGLQPSPADGVEAEKAKEDPLRGPQMPDMAKEGRVGAELSTPRPGAAGDPAAAPDAEAPAGEAEGPGEMLPGVPPLPGGEAPAPAPLNLGEPAADELDPLGALPPKPAAPSARPSWLDQPASAKLEQLPSVPVKLQRLPSVPTPSIGYEAIEERRAPVLEGPNLHSEDAPPALPASLQRVSRQGLQTNPAWLPGVVNELPPVNQPASVRPASHNRVTPTSAESPLGVHVIRPAGGAQSSTTSPTDEGTQQAIYIKDNAQPPTRLPAP